MLARRSFPFLRGFASDSSLRFNVVIVGGGPAGLSCAIRLKQKSPSLSVCLLDKGSQIGAHIISGNVFEPRALDELIPDWKTRSDCPVRQKVTQDSFKWLFKNTSLSLPHALLPRELNNVGNYIISLGELCQWLSVEAESQGVEIFPGFAVQDAIIDNDRVIGVRTKAVGESRSGGKRQNYEPGVDILADHIVLAEGAKGSVTSDVIDRFELANPETPQTFSLGFKEIWKFQKSQNQAGKVLHTVGYPIELSEYGGGFAYWKSDNELLIGLVVGLDYKDPSFSPYVAFQKWKSHASISELLKDGTCVSYGARVIATGGLQSLPKLQFPGGFIIGCASGGTLNVPKIKGTHTAMKSGMLVAECISDEKLSRSDGSYESELKKSWMWEELFKARNCKPSFSRFGGMLGGLAYSWLSLLIQGKEPWTFKGGVEDWRKTKPAMKSIKTGHPNIPRDFTSFPLMDSVARTGVVHEEDQPCHLKIRKGFESVPVEVSLKNFSAPETRFCPAGVYEFVDDKLVINASNCIHCKSCAIKTPMNYIKWTVPEGGGGPNYLGM